MINISKKYRYFHIRAGKVIGFIESSFKLDDPNLIAVDENNEKYFMRKDILLGVKDGKIVEIKENG